VVVSFKLNYAISAKDFVILAKFLLTEKIFISQRRKEIIFYNIFLIREIRQNS
jgi:hypothetical protein